MLISDQHFSRCRETKNKRSICHEAHAIFLGPTVIRGRTFCTSNLFVNTRVYLAYARHERCSRARGDSVFSVRYETVVTAKYRPLSSESSQSLKHIRGDLVQGKSSLCRSTAGKFELGIAVKGCRWTVQRASPYTKQDVNWEGSGKSRSYGQPTFRCGTIKERCWFPTAFLGPPT